MNTNLNMHAACRERERVPTPKSRSDSEVYIRPALGILFALTLCCGQATRTRCARTATRLCGRTSMACGSGSRCATPASGVEPSTVTAARRTRARAVAGVDARRQEGSECVRRGQLKCHLPSTLTAAFAFAGQASGMSPPFGKTLSKAILVPFPVESCLSGVAPNSSAAVVQRMWYRLTFDAARLAGAKGKGKTLIHFGAIDWQASVYFVRPAA